MRTVGGQARVGLGARARMLQRPAPRLSRLIGAHIISIMMIDGFPMIAVGHVMIAGQIKCGDARAHGDKQTAAAIIDKGGQQIQALIKSIRLYL